MKETLKNNCIYLKKGDIVTHDGVLYTPERHEAIEHLMSPEGIKELIKEETKDTIKGVGQHG
ncbi:MAG: hypothetical protein LBM02_08045 [Lachnospiraceae bacterium]|jgi:hypothetical protein|nr:hypothetical protein [Lachnospiraceae bacterium]